MILDVTSGNRFMWRNKFSEHIVFMDKDKELTIKPEVIAVWEHLPFRDNVFSLVVFDPPHYYNVERNSTIWTTPNIDVSLKKWYNWQHKRSKTPYYGWDITYEKLISGIVKGTREFYRVSKRLCVKWNEGKIGIWKIKALVYYGWREVFHKEFKSKRAGSNNVSHWVTYAR